MPCKGLCRFAAPAVSLVVLGPAVILAGTPRAAAVHPVKPQRRPAMTAAMTKMEKGLKLSPAQQKKLDALERDTQKRLSTIQSKRSLTPEQRSAQVEQVNNAERAGFTRILTQAQTNQYYSLLSRSMMQRLMHTRSGVRPRPR